jgi:hypothetical protein
MLQGVRLLQREADKEPSQLQGERIRIKASARLLQLDLMLCQRTCVVIERNQLSCIAA